MPCPACGLFRVYIPLLKMRHPPFFPVERHPERCYKRVYEDQRRQP
ncbi:hypothetical protein HMPREF3038_02326 [Akkermansia sp. KLE1797]|nr:hypothetical protein HMPREF3038_02326 [Akkermansia sp. KLE1797]KXU53696.1 hypothetical protein HMPREF3039_02142 [Akkermansia sp. KLE1798]KZA03903.1 hypothetical protein HMPREF1326_02443 [Akkermansia sp. KLE1605]